MKDWFKNKLNIASLAAAAILLILSIFSLYQPKDAVVKTAEKYVEAALNGKVSDLYKLSTMQEELSREQYSNLMSYSLPDYDPDIETVLFSAPEYSENEEGEKDTAKVSVTVVYRDGGEENARLTLKKLNNKWLVRE